MLLAGCWEPCIGELVEKVGVRFTARVIEVVAACAELTVDRLVVVVAAWLVSVVWLGAVGRGGTSDPFSVLGAHPAIPLNLLWLML